MNITKCIEDAMTRRRNPNEVPRIIKQASKAVDDDVKPTLHLLGKIFFNAWPNPHPPAQESPKRAERVALPRASATPQRIIVRNVGETRPRSASRAPAPPPILDAEIVDDDENFAICLTCDGNGKLGRQGHEIPCPVCSPHRVR